MKERTTINISKETKEKFKKTGLNISQFCEDCMEAYVELDDEGLGRRIQSLDDEIKRLEYQRYLVASRHSQDFERKQEIIDELPSYWKHFTEKAEEYYIGIVPIDEFDDFRRITGFLKQDIKDLAEYLYESKESGRDDYRDMVSDFKYCVQTYNAEHDRIIRGDIL